MKVYLPGLNKQPTSGKGFFYSRLSPALQNLGINIVSNPDLPHDVSIHSAKIRPTKGKKNVLRLDGIYHNTGQPYKSMNNPIRKALRRADGVIYQSNYAKSLCDVYLEKKTQHAVIYNGMELDYWKNVKPIECDYQHVFISASRWRPHKRIVDIIESFRLANISSSVLFVAGDLRKCGASKEWRKNHFKNNIQYLGTLKQPELHRYFKAARASIHLCWFDACPNSVVESICCGTPVICNNTGGTPELVSHSGGYICEIDSPYNFKPVDLYHPPKIDRNLVAQAFRKSTKESLSLKKETFNINTIAVQYLDFFEKVMKG